MFKNKFIVSLFLIPIAAILISVIVIFFSDKLFKTKNEGAYDISKKTAIFHGKEYQVPEEIIQPVLGYNVFTDIENNATSNVLGSESNKEKRIEIDLSSQTLYAYEGNEKVMSFLVSTGKWGLTPTGEYQIWIKLRYTLMTGGSKDLGTYYYLPNVPYTMYFYKGYAIHGAYWHTDWGHPISHGCINMQIPDAEKLFYWANPVIPSNTNSIKSTEDNPGTKVIIYGTTPKD